jgi:hypothetical protein
VRERSRTPALPPSSSRDRLAEARLDRVFLKIRDFVGRKSAKLSREKLLIGCRDIHFQRRQNKSYSGCRSFMHMGHVPGAICTIRQAAQLSDGHLVGLFLHEFGHAAGGDSEPAANGWVKDALGIEIHYHSPLDLQWVSPVVVDLILKR